MTTVSVCTTAPTLAETNLVLHTHIDIFPASPVILHLQCALQPCSSSPTHLPRHGPLISVNDGLLVLDEPGAALAERASLVVAAKAEGKLVIVKNGHAAWARHGATAVPYPCAEDVRIIFHAPASSAMGDAMSPAHVLRIAPHTCASESSTYVIQSDGKTVLEVQDAFRAILRKHAPRKTLGLSADMRLQPYVHRQNLRMVVAIGGLSECGKSTVGKEVDTILSDSGRREKLGCAAPSHVHLLSFPNAFRIPAQQRDKRARRRRTLASGNSPSTPAHPVDLGLLQGTFLGLRPLTRVCAPLQLNS
jgi:hypothetical protein